MILDTATQTRVNNYLNKPSHALLLSAPEGAGKASLAIKIASSVLGISEDKLAIHPYFLILKPIKSTHSIEAVLSLQEFTKLKTTGKNPIRRLVVVEDAHYLTPEAQNAFLKLLEEPPEDTIFILTVTDKRGLLPTIVSRTQNIDVQIPSKDELVAYFKKKGYTETEVTKAFHISEGYPGLMAALLAEDTEHELVGQIAAAKKIMSSSFHDRLLAVESLTKDKDALEGFLFGLQRVIRAGLDAALEKDSKTDIKRLHKSLESVVEKRQQLQRNPQIKLFLDDLILNI